MEVNVKRLLVRLDKAQGREDERIWLRQSLAFLDTQDIKALGPEWEQKRALAQDKLDALEPIQDENPVSLKSTPSLSSEFLDTSLSPLEAQRRDILLSNMGTFQSRKVLMERHAQSSVSMYKNELSNVSSRKPHSVELSDRELLLGEKTLSQDQKQTLDYHRKLQDNLTNELAKGASRLKENTSQFTDLLKKDREILESTERDLDRNMARVKKENEKIVKLTNSSWTTTLLIWGSIMLVVLVFMSTFVFMRTFRPRVRPPKEKVQSATMAASTLSKVSPTPSTADESLIFEEGYLW